MTASAWAGLFPEGTLPGGLPFLAFGSGPPLLALPGFGPHNRNPTGFDRSTQTRGLRPQARRFTVHLVQRRPSLPQGTTMGHLAVEAEDAFDVMARLGDVTAPTMVVAGGRDGFYSTNLFLWTARGIPDGHLLLYPRSSHLSALRHRSAQRAITTFLADEEKT